MSVRKSCVIIKDTNGDICYVACNRMLDENEINKAINEMNKYHQKVFKEKQEMLNEIETLYKRINDIEKEIKLLKGEE